MPTFTRHDVRRLASLARLELSTEETAVFTRQLADVLEFVRQIQAVDTTSLDVAASAVASAATLREDRVLSSLERAEVLAASPAADPAVGLFKVPRVLNG